MRIFFCQLSWLLFVFLYLELLILSLGLERFIRIALLKTNGLFLFYKDMFFPCENLSVIHFLVKFRGGVVKILRISWIFYFSLPSVVIFNIKVYVLRRRIS